MKANLFTSLLGNAMFIGTTSIARTVGMEAIGLGELNAHRQAGRPVMLAGWHSQAVAYMAAYHRLFGPGSRAVIMPLKNARGSVLNRFAERLGLETIGLGDTPGERARAVGTLIRALRRGSDALLAADGPDGPALQAKEALVRIAERAGAVLVPCGMACTNSVTLTRRWDRHVVPLYGARLIFHFGPPANPEPGHPAAAILAALQQGIVLSNQAAKQLLERAAADESPAFSTPA